MGAAAGATVGWGGGGVQQRDGGSSEGGQQWGCLQPLTPSHHKYMSTKQFELKEPKISKST